MRKTSDVVRPVAGEEGEYELRIYGPVGRWPLTGEEVKDSLRYYADGKSVTVCVNSPGGSVLEGYAIFNALQAYPGRVSTRIEGVAASVASLLALAGRPVKMCRNALLMIHNPTVETDGDAAELRKSAEVLDKVKAQMVAAYAAKTGRRADEIAAWMDAETWFDADEALAAGFVDEIVEPVFRAEPQAFAKRDPSAVWTAFRAAAGTPFDGADFEQPEKHVGMTNENDLNKFLAGLVATDDDRAAAAQIRGVLDENRRLKEAVAALEAEVVARDRRAVEEFLDAAVAEGRIAESERATYRKVAANNFEEAKKIVASKPKPRSLTAIVNRMSGYGAGSESWTFREWMKNDPKGLEKMREHEPERFSRLHFDQYQKYPSAQN